MKLPAITFTHEALSRFDEVIEREWLITNGLGGYASSSVLGINTRKYHGLLVAALNPPGDRTVCLSKLDEDVIVGKDIYRLGANDFHDVIYPQGYKLIKEFSIAPYPKYSYELGSIKIEKTIFMPKNKNVVSTIYKVNNQNNFNIEFRIYPLLTCRYFHNVVDRRKNPRNFTQKSGNKEFEIIFQNPQATFICQTSDGEFKEKLNWVDRLFYRDEAEREESSKDDCFQP
jgi:predicted glycogen debranching enzyme